MLTFRLVSSIFKCDEAAITGHNFMVAFGSDKLSSSSPNPPSYGVSKSRPHESRISHASKTSLPFRLIVYYVHRVGLLFISHPFWLPVLHEHEH